MRVRVMARARAWSGVDGAVSVRRRRDGDGSSGMAPPGTSAANAIRTEVGFIMLVSGLEQRREEDATVNLTG